MNNSTTNSLIGRNVTFPVDDVNTVNGVVVKEDETGKVIIEDADGNHWKGWEYQLIEVERI